MNLMPSLPSKEEMEACMRFQGITSEEDIQRIIAENEILLAKYLAEYPDNWKPDHLK